jgi:hypothetical protein
VKNVRLWGFGLLGFAFAILFGRWAQSLFTTSELVHFSVNFPSEGRAETMSCCDIGGSWEREHDPEWNDYPAGGLLVYGEEGALVLDVGREGLLKRAFQPRFVSISSHWLRNVGTQPYRIRVEVDLCDIELEWETFERDWDPVSHTSTRYIDPGKSYNMDWYFHIPPELFQRSVVCEGELRILDADTDKLLTDLPVKIVNSRGN